MHDAAPGGIMCDQPLY